MWELHYMGGQTDGLPGTHLHGSITMPLLEQTLAQLMLRMIGSMDQCDLTDVTPAAEEWRVHLKLTWRPSPIHSFGEAPAEESLHRLIQILRDVAHSCGDS